MNDNYILNLLRSGRTADSIAKEMADALNGASVAYAAEEKAKREAEEKIRVAREEAAKRDERKKELAAEVACAMKNYIDEFYPSWGEKVSVDEFADTFIKSVDITVKFEEKLSELDPDGLMNYFFGD